VTASVVKFEFADSRRISRLVSAKGDPHRIIADEVGPAYWDYRRRWEAAKSFKLKLPFPLHVDYELFYRCNLSCPICLMSLPHEEKRRWGDPTQSLSLETVKELLDEGAAKGQAAVGLNGICEPLLSPDLPDIVRYARSVGMLDVMFNTNGLLLDQAVSRELIQAGLTRIMISLDAATPDTYKKIRIGSDFARVTENILRFIDLREKMGAALPIVRVSFCLTSLNEHELEDFIRLWSPLVDFFSIQQYGNTFEGRFAEDRRCLFPKNHPYQPTGPGRCGQPWKRIMVRHNGDVIPCCDASGLALIVGNIHQNSLEEIWQGEKAEAIRTLHLEGRFTDHSVCRQCMTKWGPTPDEIFQAPGG